MSLSLLTTNRRELAPDAWLQFDTRNQEFVGIPLEEEVGRTEYQLVSDLVSVSIIAVKIKELTLPNKHCYSLICNYRSVRIEMVSVP